MRYECGDGWLSLINQAIEIVNEYNDKHTKINDHITITNIKEDNGCLSIDFKPYVIEIALKFYDLEKQSLRICEICGSKHNVVNTTINGNKKTLCENCFKKLISN